jgi:hypothetical protein
LAAAVSLLLLEALFMQISGVSLALTWPCRLCLLRVFLCASAASFPLSKHTGESDTALAFSGLCVYLQFMWEVGLLPSPVQFSSHHLPAPDYWVVLLSCQPPCLFTVHVGNGSSPLSCGVFLPLPLSQAFPLLVAGCTPGSRWSLSGPPGLFIYSSGKDSLPPIFSSQCAPTLSCVSLLFLLLITQFLFFSRVEVSLSRGLCCSGPGLFVGVPRYCEAHLASVFPSHLGMGDWQPGGPPCFSV